MIPLRDENPSRDRPVVTTLIVLANVLAFLYQLQLGPALSQFFQQFAVIPADIWGDSSGDPVRRALPLVTSLFLHGGWLHLIGNMWMLWIFGDNVEDRLGHGRYLLFYLLGGVVANVAHILTNPHSALPTIGASGAIGAVLGAYACLHPRAKVLTLIPLGFFLQTVEVPAWIFLGIWFGLQLLQGTFSLFTRGAQEVGGIAFWAHIGGFAYGYLAALFFRGKPERPEMLAGFHEFQR